MEEPRRLGDRYELGAVLGRGGMAEVHLGRDIRLGRTVAVKTLRNDLLRDPTFQARFRREAQSAASLNHPAVVAVYDTGEDLAPDGTPMPYIVMEYVDGCTLRELLNNESRLLPERALEMTAGILQALAYSHRHGIVHRDIKPANVMLTEAGQVKVMDFGIARALHDTSATMTQTAAVIGTAQYLSPEQAKGEPVDARSDLYSAACLLFELLTTRPPFIGDSPVSIAYQHVREDPVPPSTFDAEVPPEVDAIVLKGLAKHPDNRYQNADEMRADIERALAGHPVVAPPVFANMATQQLHHPGHQTTTVMGQVGGGDHGGYGTGQYDYDEPAEPQRKVGQYVVLSLAAIAVFIGGIMVMNYFNDERTPQGGPTPGMSSSPPSTNPTPSASTSESTEPAALEMPFVVGKSAQNALDELTALGFDKDDIKVEYKKRDGIPANQVYAQSEPKGSKVQPGTRIVLQAAKASEKVKVPYVLGKTENEARKAIRDAGLVPRSNKVQEPNQYCGEPGRVCGQTPEASEDDRVDEGSEVTIDVLRGEVETPGANAAGGGPGQQAPAVAGRKQAGWVRQD